MASKNQESDRRYLLLGLRIVGEFGAIIALPLVLFTLFGRWLDARLGTRPAFLIGGFALSAAISAISVFRKAKAFAKEYQAIDRSPAKRAENSRDI